MKLSDVRNLYEKGFALIYLHEKSKRPLEQGWTSGNKKLWEELRESFNKHYNLGVRLGEPSRMGSGYLACIDVDIKDVSKKKIALEKLKELVGDLKFPEVRSGSGNGSRHLYCVTREPFKMVTVAKEKGWEICIYSTGRQMVLPPSIHPDTGFRYQWLEGCTSKLPLFDVSGLVSVKAEREISNEKINFKAEEVDLYGSKLSMYWIKTIEEGLPEGDDWSDAVYKAACAMCRHGFTDNQILSVLANEAHGLSEGAYKRRGHKKGAIDWLTKYALSPAKHDTNIMRRFDNPPEKREPLTEKQSEVLESELNEVLEQTGYYTRGQKGALKANHDALLTVFKKSYPYKMIADMKNVFVFKHTHYVDLTHYEIKAFAEQKFLPKPEEKVRQEFYNKVLANNVVRRNFFIDTTEGKINFKNGVLDVAGSGELLKHSPEFGFRGVLPYEFDPGAKCPAFKEWLESVMLEDVELQKLLQEFMGYIVRGGEYKYHKALWLGGVGRNGKSTFVDILKALIGIGNFSVISIKALMTDKFAGADMDGKIANFSEETSPQELADSGPFKNLTGDGDLFAQKKFGDPYTFRNRAKLVMTYNTIPDLKDLSHGMLSRPIIIPFEKTISEKEQDRNIKQKLLGELPGIFNFALRGWKRLERQGGFTQSDRSDVALQKVKEESCNVFQWVENHIEISRGSKMKPGQLYLAYSSHERYAFKEVEFYRRLKSHPFMVDKHKHTNEGNYYLNVGLI